MPIVPGFGEEKEPPSWWSIAHSSTSPDPSYMPQSLGFFWAADELLPLPAHEAISLTRLVKPDGVVVSSPPLGKMVVVPARTAISHCAAVGRSRIQPDGILPEKIPRNVSMYDPLATVNPVTGQSMPSPSNVPRKTS